MRRWVGVVFAGFCLIAGSRWLVDGVLPGIWPPLLEEGLGFAVGGVGALAFCVFARGNRFGAGWLWLACVGLLVFGVPALLNDFAHGEARSSGPALFAMAPLFVVVAGEARGARPGARSLMMPALVGLAGALLLLPFELPATGRGGWMFLLVGGSVLLTAFGSVWMHQALRGCGNLAGAVAVVCAVNALLLVPAGLAQGHFMFSGLGQELVRVAVFDGPSMVLLLWLMRETPPERLATRFFLVPLVAVMEGLLLIRPRVDLRAVTGMLLLAVGAGLMLRTVPAVDDTGLHLDGSK